MGDFVKYMKKLEIKKSINGKKIAIALAIFLM